MEGASKGNGLSDGMADQFRADLMTAAMKHREAGIRQTSAAQCIENRTGEHFAGAWMSRVSLDDDWTTGSEGANRVRADDADGEREIAGTKNDNWSDGLEDAAHVGFGCWHTFRHGAVNAGLSP
jgi:hypothetical protein